MLGSPKQSKDQTIPSQIISRTPVFEISSRPLAQVTKIHVEPAEILLYLSNWQAEMCNNYSRAWLIRTQNTWKICANYPSLFYFMFLPTVESSVVYRTIVWIIREVRISEGQIIRAILYLKFHHTSALIMEKLIHKMHQNALGSYVCSKLCWSCMVVSPKVHAVFREIDLVARRTAFGRVEFATWSPNGRVKFLRVSMVSITEDTKEE